MRVKVLKVWPDTKQAWNDLKKKKETRWGTQCTWGEHKDERISIFFEPQPDAEYDVEVTPREYKGKTYYSIYEEGQLVSAPQPAPQNGTGTGQTRQTTLPIMAELRAVGAIVKAIKFESGEPESTTLNTALMEVFRRGAIERMAEYQAASKADEEGVRGGTPSSGDELPPDEEGSFDDAI